MISLSRFTRLETFTSLDLYFSVQSDSDMQKKKGLHDRTTVGVLEIKNLLRD
jgi:hypothetical protein